MENPIHHSHRSCLEIVPIFNHLNDENKSKISHLITDKTYNKGKVLYRAQESDNTLYIVHSGQVKIYRLSENGREQLVRILGPGDFTGEYTIFNDDSKHGEYAEAISETTACTLSHKDIQPLLSEQPTIAMEIMKEMSRRLENSEKQTAQVAVGQIGERLSMYLADLTGNEAEEEVTVMLPMSRKEIASYLGTTPESISRKFKELEKLGMITQLPRKKIKIHNVDNLLLYGE